LKLFIQAIGFDNVYSKIIRTAVAPTQAKSAMDQVATELMRIIEQTFLSQGRRGGGSWRFLQPETLRRKIRLGQDPRILFATHALFNSLTHRRDPMQDLRISNTEVRLGTKLSYARVQHATRPIVKLTKSDRRRMDKIIADHVVGHWRGRKSRL
jgi:hypothetical protein